MLTMSETKRHKVTFELEERFRRALAIFGAEHGATIGESIGIIIERHLPEFLERADRAIEAGRPSPKPRRGRKPKGGG